MEVCFDSEDFQSSCCCFVTRYNFLGFGLGYEKSVFVCVILINFCAWRDGKGY